MNGHYRALLLKWFMEMKLSETTQLKIAKIIGSCKEEEKELKAKELLSIFQTCSTEDDVIDLLAKIFSI